MIDFRQLLLPSCTRAGHRVGSKVASKAASRVASKVASRVASKVASRVASRVASKVASKKAALEEASDIISKSHSMIEARELLEGLLARERLGSTCLGDGVAIPHCRMPCERPVLALMRLRTPLDFEAPDGQPVDLLFVLVVPEREAGQHLEILGALAQALDVDANRDLLRRADNDPELFDTMMRIVARAGA